MDPFTGALLIAFAIIASFRSGAQHARASYKQTRDAETKKAAKGTAVTPAVKNKLRRRHRAGWWASEIGHGFPVTRTGIHAGWLAHQAAAMHTRAQREAARTTQLDATASFASAVKDHRERQEAARKDIEAALAESDVEQDGSRKKVRDAVDEVAAKRAEKARAAGPPETASPGATAASAPEPGPFAPKAEGPFCGACGHPARHGDPLVTVASANRPVHYSHVTDPGSGFHGEPVTSSLCRLCYRPLGLRDHDGLDHADCASTDRAAREPVSDADLDNCTECGEMLGLRANDGWAHEDCDRVSSAEADACEVRDNRDTDIVDAELLAQGRCPYQTGTDGGSTYCGRGITDTGGDEPDRYCLEHQCTVDGDDQGAVQERHERVAELLYRDRQDLTAHSTATEGDTMSGDTTFSGVKTASTAAVGLADQDTATIRGRKEAAYALADQMQALDVDPAVLDAQMSYADSLAKAEENLVAAGEFASATGTSLERYHGGMEEATVSAPGKVAAREFHGE